MSRPLAPGLLILHGNRLELLRDAVFDWLARNPLDPLEEEIFLVQSNGAGEWLKMALARANGVCAATRVELPGRFLWRTYRQVLGRQRVFAQSALEKDALTWRLMRLLPEQMRRAAFEPIAAFLADEDPDRRLQLARRLADLYDQYQVYRADWLETWEHGRALITTQGGFATPVPVDQRWQAALWRAILGELSEADRWSTRPHVHRAFMDALRAGDVPADALPRRAVLFGASHVSVQGLEALAMLATRMQVIVAVPNPCRYHWADIIDGREALDAPRRRHAPRDGDDLSIVPMTAMHLHAHPLLAMWGRQGRDFMRLLDAFDDVEVARGRFDLPRIDLFDEGPGDTLLEQAQAAIRDLLPLAEHPIREIGVDDRSIVFHVAHGPQREVETLHDQLLVMLATMRLDPKDIIVMVPDIEVFAPAIRAVFGQYGRGDARSIPFDIADLKSRGSNPLVVAFEWLLRIPDQRVRVQEVRDLLDVPAMAARVDLEAEDLPGLFAWLAGAGTRWGLNEAHREDLGLGAAGEQNTWLFGLRRMLLGYASGSADAHADIEPYDEVGGLDAAAIGSLADLFDRLEGWWSVARTHATPTEWARRGRAMLASLVTPTDEREKLTIAALQGALAAWLEACDHAKFVEAVPLSVLREGWLAGIDGLDASRRFLTGGVTFCTLMPLRAVPFEVVCLLGMNDGDFPRQSHRGDFDLMALPGQQRPGDRSRRDDDRYLMLEALLSARRVLYVSWCGRSARDNSEQPPSVLVAQLRDYLSAAWRGAAGRDVLADRTTVHPLQPFSRRYFERDGLVTFAREWRVAHDDAASTTAEVTLPPFDAIDVPLTIRTLAAFLRNPTKAFFRTRLDVMVADEEEAVDDDEAFGLDGLERYALRRELLEDPDVAMDDGIAATLARRVQRLRGSGRLPMFELGTRACDELLDEVGPMLARWAEFQRVFPEPAPKQPLRIVYPGAAVDDWLDGLRSDGVHLVRASMTPSKVLGAKDKLQAHQLVEAWVRSIVASACDRPVSEFVIGCDATLLLRPTAGDAARTALNDLVEAWQQGMTTPLPFASKTAIAFVDGASGVHEVYDGGHLRSAEGVEFSLHRLWPDYEALSGDPRFAEYAARLFEPLVRWVRDRVTIVDPALPLVIDP